MERLNHQFMANPLAIGIKKYIFDLLKEKYLEHQDAAERASSHIITEKDYLDFGKMIVGIYEKGFTDAVNQQKDLLEKHGLKVSITTGPNPTSGKSIFNQKNQVDPQI